MNRKEQFLDAVRILAPNDSLVLDVAQHVCEETLPTFPGGAALEFVAAMQRWFPRTTSAALGMPCSANGGENTGRASVRQLSLSHALRVRSAQYWLELGEPELALKELEQLPEISRRHPLAMRTRVAAMAAMRERSQWSIQA